ncbi:MAG: leucine-rich repeat domain-containing protein, partial [Clostridia bacterium]|nr:leucine-rich repeat domain-containing protein [Clostridia bacterium]
GSQDGRMPTDGSVWYIGDAAFAGKEEITAITVPEEVRGIGLNAFMNCGALQTVTLPSSLTYICANAFEYCYAIETVIFGGTEDQWYDLSIGDWNDYLLNATIYVDGGDTLLKEASGEEPGIEAPAEGMDEYGFCYERVGDEYTLVSYVGTETQLIIPDSFSGLPIQSIAMGAFQDNTALEGILIPASVRFIVAEAFQGCTSLSVLQFAEGSELVTIGSDAFQNCDSLVSVILPEGLLEIGSRAFNSCDRLEEIYLPTTLESIGTAAFAYSPKLGSVVLHEGLTTLGEDAFAGCEGLVSVSLPEGLTEIGGGAFAGCVLLESITIPASVTTLGDWMFQSCSSLVSLAVEDGNEHYAGVGNCIIAKESGALLYGCQNSQIPTDGSVTSINWYAFFECTALESITIPEGVTFIDLYAFEKCTNLRTVYLPSTLTGIAIEAFDECENLETVYYNGSQDEFETKVSIGEYNGDLTYATFVFAK